MAIIGGSGQKAATYLQPGRTMFAGSAQSSLNTRSGCVRYNYTTSGAKDVLNVSGSGVLQMGFFLGSAFTSTNSNVKITIDGTIVLNETRSGSIENNGSMQVGSFYFNGTSYQYSTTDIVPYNESLVINVTCDAASYYYYRYYRT